MGRGKGKGLDSSQGPQLCCWQHSSHCPPPPKTRVICLWSMLLGACCSWHILVQAHAATLHPRPSHVSSFPSPIACPSAGAPIGEYLYSIKAEWDEKAARVQDAQKRREQQNASSTFVNNRSEVSCACIAYAADALLSLPWVASSSCSTLPAASPPLTSALLTLPTLAAHGGPVEA